MSVVSDFLKHFNPSEKKLRAMYRIGYAAGLEQARKQSSIIPLATPVVHTVVALPTQRVEEPVKRVLVPVKPGALVRAYNLTHKKPTTPWHPPTRPVAHLTVAEKQVIYASMPTVMDIGAALNHE